jgi:ABC-2 type transport system ATP-binding protein
MSQAAIAVQGLTKRYGRHAAVDNLSFEVPAGSVCGFLGRNGAGKSTTIRALMNLVTPTAGSAQLLGQDSRRDHTALMERVGYVAEAPVLYDWMKVRDVVRFTGEFYRRWNAETVEALLRRFGVDSGQKIRHLSRGTYAQVALALALGNDPELLILDEPATGLDVIVRRDFLESIIQLIQEEGRTVLFSSHLVHEVERVADRVVMIDDGRLVISATIDQLKEEMRRVVLRRRGGAQALADMPGVVSTVRDGADLVVTVRDRDGSARQAIEEAGDEVLEVTGLSLEEIFVDLVSAGRREEAA